MSDRPSPHNPASRADSDADPSAEGTTSGPRAQADGNSTAAPPEPGPSARVEPPQEANGPGDLAPLEGTPRTAQPLPKDEARALGAGGTEPVTVPSPSAAKASEAPTELDLSPVPVSAHGVPTVHIKRVTLVSGGDDDSNTSASLRKAESYVGFIIDGRYHILDVLAQGGMGVVYRGRHRVIDKPVAIKILRPELANNREITQRFLTEAQAASAIGNEHIVDITDYGELPDGATYIVMEFLDGRALSHHVAPENRLPLDELVRIARQTAEGLQGAHDAGIVHRDLKPDNIFITRRKDDSFVKILDFGIAKVASSQNAITRAGHIFGTPHYMSPEQARGQELDNRSDIYSMGVILYELVSSQVPFDGENPLGILTQHMYTEPRPLHTVCPDGQVDAGLEAIISKCLLKEPWQRYGSMSEFDDDLARWQRGETPKAVAELQQLASSPPSLKKRLSQTRRRGFRWGFLAVGLLGGAAAIVFARGQPESALGRWLRQVQDGARTSASALSSEAHEAEPAAVQHALREVAMVLSPIDARVFRGATDLGPMPLSVRIREGQRVAFTIKRPGYASKRIVVDGTDSAARVSLEPLPGRPPVQPPTAAAAARPGQPRVVTITDAGMTHSAPPPSPFRADDAGTPNPRTPFGQLDELDSLDAGAAVGPPEPEPTASKRDESVERRAAAPKPRATPAPRPRPPAPSPAPEPPSDDEPPPPPWIGPVDSVPAPGSSERPIYDSTEPELGTE